MNIMPHHRGTAKKPIAVLAYTEVLVRQFGSALRGLFQSSERLISSGSTFQPAAWARDHASTPFHN